MQFARPSLARKTSPGPLTEFLRAIRYINCQPSVSAGGTGQMASPGERALAANGQTRQLGTVAAFGSSPSTWMRLEAQRRSSRAFCSISSTTRSSRTKKSKCPKTPLAWWLSPTTGCCRTAFMHCGSANLAFQMLPWRLGFTCAPAFTNLYRNRPVKMPSPSLPTNWSAGIEVFLRKECRSSRLLGPPCNSLRQTATRIWGL